MLEQDRQVMHEIMLRHLSQDDADRYVDSYLLQVYTEARRMRKNGNTIANIMLARKFYRATRTITNEANAIADEVVEAGLHYHLSPLEEVALQSMNPAYVNLPVSTLTKLVPEVLEWGPNYVLVQRVSSFWVDLIRREDLLAPAVYSLTDALQEGRWDDPDKYVKPPKLDTYEEYVTACFLHNMHDKSYAAGILLPEEYLSNAKQTIFYLFVALGGEGVTVGNPELDRLREELFDDVYKEFTHWYTKLYADTGK